MGFAEEAATIIPQALSGQEELLPVKLRNYCKRVGLPFYYLYRSINYTRPVARINYLFSSYVPSVVSLWNSLPDHVKVNHKQRGNG